MLSLETTVADKRERDKNKTGHKMVKNDNCNGELWTNTGPDSLAVKAAEQMIQIIA